MTPTCSIKGEERIEDIETKFWLVEITRQDSIGYRQKNSIKICIRKSLLTQDRVENKFLQQKSEDWFNVKRVRGLSREIITNIPRI
jgi:hypothetical protein